MFPSKSVFWLLEDASQGKFDVKGNEYGGVCVDHGVLLKLVLRAAYKYVYMVRRGLGMNSFQGSSFCICLYWVG